MALGFFFNNMPEKQIMGRGLFKFLVGKLVTDCDKFLPFFWEACDLCLLGSSN